MQLFLAFSQWSNNAFIERFIPLFHKIMQRHFFLNKYLIIKKIDAYVILAVFFLLILSFSYTYCFNTLLQNGKGEGLGFTGIVQGDTIKYYNMYLNVAIEQTLLLLGTKDSSVIMPALLWRLLDGNWYLASFINVSLLLFVIIYLYKISIHIGLKLKSKLLLIVILLPETFIYTIGVLKEIPTLFLFTAMAFYYLKKKWLVFLFLFLSLAIVRYQFIIIILLFVIGNIVFKKNNLRFMVILLIFLAAIYPFLYEHVPYLGQDGALIIRGEGGGIGVGSFIEIIKKNLYGLSLFATIMTLFQSIIEPWPALNIITSSGINIIALIYSLSLFFVFRIWFRYFRLIVCAFKNPNLLGDDESTLLCISFVIIVSVALNGFVHHRYLYPDLGLVVLLSSIKIFRNSSVPTINKYNKKSNSY